MSRLDLTNAWLANTALNGATLASTNLSSSELTGADLSGANLTGATLRSARMTNAMLNGATVIGAWLNATSNRGLSQQQFYSTASYQQFDLRGVKLNAGTMAGWNFADQNLLGASFFNANLISTDFSNANLASADFTQASLFKAELSGSNVRNANFTKTALTISQIYSTSSYALHDLGAIGLADTNLFGVDLASQNLAGSDFSGAYLNLANLSQAELSFSNLSGVQAAKLNLAEANLSNATLARARFSDTDFTGANLEDADISGTFFDYPTGLTLTQLYSTANYKNKDLRGVSFNMDSLEGADFSNQNLTGAVLGFSRLDTVNLEGANVASVSFGAGGLTPQQLYSTRSYQLRNLTGIRLAGDLSSFDFSNQDLTYADLSAATLTNTNLMDARIGSVDFSNAISRGLTPQKLYSTASYKAKDMQGVKLGSNDLRGWDFSRQSLLFASFGYSYLSDVRFLGADLTDASLNSASLTSTADFQNATLTRAQFGHSVLNGVNFSDLVAMKSSFQYATISDTDFSRSDLTNARFAHSVVNDANFVGANAGSAQFSSSNLTNVDFSGAYLRRAGFDDATISGVNFRGADLRGATGLSGVAAPNAILPDSTVAGLHLVAGETFRVRDYDSVPLSLDATQVPASALAALRAKEITPISVSSGVSMDPESTLIFEINGSLPTSGIPLIQFISGIPVMLDGTLGLQIQAGVAPDSLLGRTFRLFDWTGVTPSGMFDIQAAPGITWNTDQLYSSGTVMLVAVPEPGIAILVLCGAYGMLARCLRLRRTLPK